MKDNRRRRIRYSSLSMVLGTGLLAFGGRLVSVSADSSISGSYSESSIYIILALAGVFLLVFGGMVLLFAMATK